MYRWRVQDPEEKRELPVNIVNLTRKLFWVVVVNTHTSLDSLRKSKNRSTRGEGIAARRKKEQVKIYYQDDTQRNGVGSESLHNGE